MGSDEKLVAMESPAGKGAGLLSFLSGGGGRALDGLKGLVTSLPVARKERCHVFFSYVITIFILKEYRLADFRVVENQLMRSKLRCGD